MGFVVFSGTFDPNQNAAKLDECPFFAGWDPILLFSAHPSRPVDLPSPKWI